MRLLLWASLCSSVLCLAFSGCGGGTPGKPKPIPVSGKVVWNGQPVTTGSVLFSPVDRDKGHLATGEIDSKGNYVASTFEKKDGVVPGSYKISVNVFEGEDPVAKKPGKPILPQKYYTGETSGLTATIEAKDKTKVVDLTLEGQR
nr:hypothetical protein [uncultured bacterium]